MKKLLLLVILALLSLSTYADCQLSGKFKITGEWTSFSEWFVVLDNGTLVDSYTDDLPSSEWITSLNIQYGSYLALTQTTYASDAIIDTILHLKAKCVNGKLSLSPYASYETYFDETTNVDPVSVIHINDLSVVQY